MASEMEGQLLLHKAVREGFTNNGILMPGSSGSLVVLGVVGNIEAVSGT